VRKSRKVKVLPFVTCASLAGIRGLLRWRRSDKMSLCPLLSVGYTSPFNPFSLPFAVAFSPSAIYELLHNHWNGLIGPPVGKLFLAEPSSAFAKLVAVEAQFPIN
jgi:hypothetical protein